MIVISKHFIASHLYNSEVSTSITQSHGVEKIKVSFSDAGRLLTTAKKASGNSIRMEV